MNIYAKYLGKNPEIINLTIKGQRPFFIPKNGVNDLDYSRRRYGFDSICWEANIISQIWENKYGWFDFSKNLIDIGAGWGEYPIFAGFAHSYAFEPNKERRCFIYANMISHDKVSDIDVIPYCISDNPGFREFGGWSEDPDNTGRPEVAIMEYKTLDSFNFENVGLIKADIEGFEYNAIKSGMDTIARNNYPPLLIEVWHDEDLKMYNPKNPQPYLDRKQSLLEMLDKLGYIMISDPNLGDWETKFFIHNTRLGSYKQS